MAKKITKGEYEKKSFKILIYLVGIICTLLLGNNVFALEKHYELDDYNVKIAIPSDYDVIIKSEVNTIVYDKLGLDKEDMDNYMDSLKAYLLATTPDLKKNIIFTRKQDDNTKNYYNLSELDENIVDGLAQGFAQGFNINDYNIEKVNDITYIKLKYDLISAKDEHLYYLKYKTFYNGYDYTVYIQKYSNITKEDEDELKDVIKKFEIEKIDNPNKLSQVYITPIWITVLFCVGMIVWGMYKSNNKNKKETTKSHPSEQKKEDTDNKVQEQTKDKNHNKNKELTKTDIDKKYSDLNKLKELLDNDIITKEEFDQEKKKILKD